MAHQSGGKRRGARKGARSRQGLRRDVLGLALGITLTVLAWGYLVYAAVDFGSDARGGEGKAWGFLALAAIGAAACLFIALLLGARILRTLASAPLSREPAASDRPTGSHQKGR